MTYGGIVVITDSGASWHTAEHYKLTCQGVDACRTIAKTHSERIRNYKTEIEGVGRIYGIESTLTAAISSRESRARYVVHDGWEDWNPSRQAYNAWGLMQVDVNPNGGGHTARGEWDSVEHLCQATEILVYFIDQIRKKISDLSKEQQLKGAIAAYNAGDRKVHSYAKVEENTTGIDYSDDGVGRAEWYEHNRFNG
uniref:Lysozyme g n=1 Tax=Brachirus orientalis TaxID=435138 RepID=L7XB22_9PLEU|nr:lysozyme g [Brachirus orientalis]